ncbi:MAG TPA: aldehyde dehydrogenase (NADP(+)) [Terriglobales bacterium]|nr:aldehyde dehydrogenase (NADP(+)) [Terriglobales bacterium]
MNLAGCSIIGSRRSLTGGTGFRAYDPTTAQAVEPDFFSATLDEVNEAARLAHEAFVFYSRASGREKAEFLRRIAGNIESAAGEVIQRARLETALPEARLQAETARTCGQLRMFAQVVEEGSWVMARIDRADPNRKPNPKPDIRSMLRPVGPVAVFGASNFPLAFSVAGGDTASALAAGNPVIVKAHPAHPGTSELAGRAIQQAVRDCKLHEGVFSLLFDSGTEAGAALVRHPLVKAVGFTGSRKGGRALMDIAAARPEPIPIFAEMSSTNPVFILPGALREHAGTIAAGLFASFTMGAGQFCTKPGMVFVPEQPEISQFISRLESSVADAADFHLLTGSIRSAYEAGIRNRKEACTVKLVAGKPSSAAGYCADLALFETSAKSFRDDPALSEEIFGPSTLLVRHSGREELLEIARRLEGHLTATIHGTSEDLSEFRDLIAILETKVGRIVFNGFPTGVEVTHAMVHGGPYPATSDGRSTSVGSQAIFRFCRPVCYQGFPNEALPAELQNANPLAIWRMLDGELTKNPL